MPHNSRTFLAHLLTSTAGWPQGGTGPLTLLHIQFGPSRQIRAVEFAYERYNAQLQSSVYKAQYMRNQIRMLQSRLGSASTDAETQKIQGSLTSADAALQDLETSIQLSSEQINVARTLAVNRQDQEREAYEQPWIK